MLLVTLRRTWCSTNAGESRAKLRMVPSSVSAMWGFDHDHPIRSMDIFAAPMRPRTLPHRPTSSTRAACHRLTNFRIGKARDRGLLRLPSCLAVSNDACHTSLAHLHIGAAVASLVTSRSLSASVTSSDVPLARGIVDAAMVLRSEGKREHGTPTTPKNI